MSTLDDGSAGPADAESTATGRLPLPDGPPPTMPVEARTGGPTPPPPPDAPAEGAGGVPAGTAPEGGAAPGSSEELPPTQGVHRPDAGPGGDDLDTAARPLPNRSDADRA
jgi:hypothetical protein